MRFVTYVSARGDERVGLVVDEQVRSLAPGRTLLELLDTGELDAAGERARTKPDEIVPLDGLTLRAPLQPRSIRDSTGFLQHMRNAAAPAGITVDERYSQFPPFYMGNTASVIGPHADVPIFPGSSQFDYELEVCAVIGTAASNVPLEQAEQHIAGYMLFCDWSARDLQVNEMGVGLGPAKGKDGANTLGPMLVTPDELEPYRSGAGFDLAMRGWVNDDLVSEGNWSTIDWGFADMIVYTSRGTTLRPGDVIGSGTVPTGCLFEHFAVDRDGFRGWLAPGDQVRLAVDQLGELRHRITASAPAHPLSTGH